MQQLPFGEVNMSLQVLTKKNEFNRRHCFLSSPVHWQKIEGMTVTGLMVPRDLGNF